MFWKLSLIGEPLQSTMKQKFLRFFSLVRKAFILIKSGRTAQIWSKIFQRRGVSYQKWLDTHYGATSNFQILLSSSKIIQVESILFSIIIPTFNSHPKFLEEAVDSVLNQTYSNWELILVDDASTPETIDLLYDIKKRDSRINLRLNNQHIGIAGGLNVGIGVARGSFIGFLDHDDVLHEEALKLVAISIQQNPNLKLIYTDEDKIDISSKLYDPYFKPDWNPDLLLSQNYVNHFSAYSKKFLEKMGGFRLGFDGAQDWDLLLRSERCLRSQEIFHIPMVLYHWRSVKGSTALADTEKAYISKAQYASLSAHLTENRINADIERLANGWWILNRRENPLKVKATIIIPTRDNLALLKACITSIKNKTCYPNYEILVVDNRSGSDTKEYLFKLKNSNIIQMLEYDQVFNFADLNNLAAEQSDSRVLVFLNNDTEIISEHWLEYLIANAIRPEIGAVGAMLYYPDMYIQHAGIVLGIGGVAGHVYQGFYKGYPGQFGRAQLPQNYSAVTGACMAIEKDKFFNARGFDAINLPIAFNDVDLCLKLQEQGYRNLWLSNVELIHKESASRGYEDASVESQERFDNEYNFMKNKWGKWLLTDPAYNPNLTLDHFDTTLSEMPRIHWLEALVELTEPPES